MSIEELEYKHFKIPDETYLSSIKHSLVSVEFAISVLEELDIDNFYHCGHEQIVKNKIQELKQYLNENKI